MYGRHTICPRLSWPVAQRDAKTSDTYAKRDGVGRTPLTAWVRLLVTTSTVLVLLAFVAVAVRLGMVIHQTVLLFALGVSSRMLLIRWSNSLLPYQWDWKAYPACRSIREILLHLCVTYEDKAALEAEVAQPSPDASTPHLFASLFLTIVIIRV